MEKKDLKGHTKEKLSTVISRYVFLILLVVVVVVIVLDPTNAKSFEALLNAMVELNIYTFIGVLVGAGAINKIAEMFNNYRAKK